MRHSGKVNRPIFKKKANSIIRQLYLKRIFYNPLVFNSC